MSNHSADAIMEVISAVKLQRIVLGSLESKPIKKVISKIVKLSDFDMEEREVVVTAIRGAYNGVSHFVISVNGSPPRGNILVDANLAIGGTAMAFFNVSEAKKFRGKNYEAICDFLKSKIPLFD